MKRFIVTIAIILILSACGTKETLIHDDFRSDLEQVFEGLDLAYKENRTLNDSERGLLEKFNDKYILGQFSTDEEDYEMSDLEKKITREVVLMRIFTEHDEPLASEKTVYERTREEIGEYLNASEVPEDLVGKYPTYERQVDVHSHFIKDVEEMIDNLDPVVNIRYEIYQDEYDRLQEYVELYGGDGFEVEGTHYLHNEDSHDMYMVFWSINRDLDDGVITGYSQDRFNELKDELK